MSIFTIDVLPAAFIQIIAWTSMRPKADFSECAILGMEGAGS